MRRISEGTASMKLMRPTLLLVAGLLVWWIWPRPEDWTATVYNDSALTLHRHVEGLSSLEECRAAAWAALQEAGWTEAGTYECGLNCEPFGSLGYDMRVCEETVE